MEQAFRQASNDPGLAAMVRGDVLKGLFTLNSAPAENPWERELEMASNDIAGAGRLMNNLRNKRRVRKDDCMWGTLCLMAMFNCPPEHHSPEPIGSIVGYMHQAEDHKADGASGQSLHIH